jgi:DNA-binding NtrC family response regulator
MTREKPSILIVEDEAKLRRLLELQLTDEGFITRATADAESALPLLNKDSFDLVVTDFKLPGMSGLEFLLAVKRVDAELPVIIMTAFGTVESAVEAMKNGASDFVLKPFSLAEMVLVIRKELAARKLREENRDLREALGHRYQYANIIAQSEKMQAVLALVERVAPTNATVLIGGESGVGKDLIARAIHEHSHRANGPFIKINSTAIPETLLESELFGYEKGAFSGATSTKPGKFELADKGTLFLDEIGDVPPAIQVKLLRVLQEREFERLGGTRTLKVDVRLIAATNRDLRAALEEGTFREDLYYRLNVVAIDIPPLRDHKEDVPALVEFFLKKFARESGKPVQSITPVAMRLLVDYHWPGNVRELQNVIERAVTLSAGTLLDVDDVHLDSVSRRAAAIAPDANSRAIPAGFTLEQWEEEIIREALKAANGNKSQAARALGLSRNALRYRLSKIGVPDRPDSDIQ